MKSRFAQNLVASVLAQLLRYGAPLAFYPYLTRTLGADGFAAFALAFAAAVMLGQLVEFGFGLSGGRALAEADENPRAAAEVVGDVVIGRIVMLLVVVAGACLFLPFAPDAVRRSASAALAIGVLAAGYGFSATWYFMGRERAARLAGLEILTSFSQLILLVTFVHEGAPAWLPILMMAAPVWAMVGFGHFLAFRELGVILPGLSRLREKLTESFQFFCFTGIQPILNRATLLVLGAMSSSTQVAYYAVGERIVTAAANATVPVVRVAMPRITRLVSEDIGAARRLFRRSLLGLTGVALGGSVVGASLAPWGVPLIFGKAMAPGAIMVAIQLFIVPAIIAARLAGTLGLVPLHKERFYQAVVLSGGAVGLAGAPLAVWLGGGVPLAMLRLAADTAMASVLVVGALKLYQESSR